MVDWREILLPLMVFAVTAYGESIREEILRKLPQDKCGETSEQGTKPDISVPLPVTLGAYPWIAAIGYSKDNSSEVDFRCGGSLISDQYVLTSAHCLHPMRTKKYTPVVVRLGELDIDGSVEDGAQPVFVEVEKFIYHKEFHALYKLSDIGLIKLKRKVEFNNLIKPICLPLPEEFETNSFVNMETIVAGWGSKDESKKNTSRPHEIHLRVTDLDECRRNITEELIHVRMSEKMVCAYAPGMAACHGDTGSTLMILRNHEDKLRFYALGVMSFAYGCALEGYPGVYTRVSEYFPWILANIEV